MRAPNSFAAVSPRMARCGSSVGMVYRLGRVHIAGQVGTVKIGSGWGPVRKPPRASHGESQLPRVLTPASASSDSLLLSSCERGSAPFHTFPPISRAANEFAAVSPRMARCGSSVGMVYRLGRVHIAGQVGTVKIGSGWGPVRKPPRASHGESQLPRVLTPASASSDSLLLSSCERGSAPFHTFPPISRAANEFAAVSPRMARCGSSVGMAYRLGAPASGRHAGRRPAERVELFCRMVHRVWRPLPREPASVPGRCRHPSATLFACHPTAIRVRPAPATSATWRAARAR